jgi:hypothetical protein
MNFIANRDGKDGVDIHSNASFDGGKTWGERVIVNDDPQSGISHEPPGISVAPNGRIDLAWSDYRFTPRAVGNTGMQDVFYASSIDGGKTFTKNVRITDRSIDRTLGVSGGAIGSSINVGVTSTDDAVVFARQDSRNARPSTQSEDVYNASFRVTGDEAGAGDSDEGWSMWAVLFAGIALGAGSPSSRCGRSHPAGGSRPTPATA